MHKISEDGRERLIDDVKKESVTNRKLVGHRFFFGFAYDVFTHTSLYTQWQAFLTLLRRFRTLVFLWRVLTVLFTIIETGALVLLTTAIFLVLLPLATSLMLGILITALLESRRTNRQMSKLLDEKQVYVLFLSQKDNPFLEQNARLLSHAENSAVIVVSPYLVSPRGLCERGFYCTARREGENLYLIRRYYYFSLWKHVLRGKQVAYLY